MLLYGLHVFADVENSFINI